MPFVIKPIEEIKSNVEEMQVDSFSNNEKFDVLLVIMIVLLMFAFKNVTAFIMKLVGALIVGLGVYTLFVT